MKSIISTLAKPPFNFDFTDEDIQIFEHIHKDYQEHMVSEEYSLLFANITFLLINRQILDFLLAHLEADVKRSWSAKLGVHKPQEYISCLGLKWPVPAKELADNHSHHLLSKVFLKTERAHGINLDDNQGAPVPTLFGYVAPDLVRALVNKNRLWNDETRLSGLLFHGKSIHRLQLNLVMTAIDRKILDVDAFTMPDLLKIFTRTYTRFRLTLAWDLLFDNINLNSYVSNGSAAYDDPVQNVLAPHYSRQINENIRVGRYVYCTDPYYFHSYLMTHSRNKTPYLSECVTQSFAKAAFTIQKIEASTGKKIENGPPVFMARERVRSERDLQPQELDMRSVLKRQEECFVMDGEHIVNEKRVKDFNAQEGKASRILSTVGNIEYRRLLDEVGESAYKRAKM